VTVERGLVRLRPPGHRVPSGPLPASTGSQHQRVGRPIDPPRRGPDGRVPFGFRQDTDASARLAECLEKIWCVGPRSGRLGDEVVSVARSGRLAPTGRRLRRLMRSAACAAPVQGRKCRRNRGRKDDTRLRAAACPAIQLGADRRLAPTGRRLRRLLRSAACAAPSSGRKCRRDRGRKDDTRLGAAACPAIQLGLRGRPLCFVRSTRSTRRAKPAPCRSCRATNRCHARCTPYEESAQPTTTCRRSRRPAALPMRSRRSRRRPSSSLWRKSFGLRVSRRANLCVAATRLYHCGYCFVAAP